GILRDELFAHHRKLVDRILDAARRHKHAQSDPVAFWIERHEVDVRRVVEMTQEMHNLARMDYATLSVAVRSLGHMLSATEE
ncbi:MAG TPA: hypothetical protein VK830_04145, partial [Xanthomonadales bacterium]|nr:hypothetical protein [Xanthomonadales bacterium]